MVKKDNPERVIINTERVKNIGFQLVPDQQKEFKNFLLMNLFEKPIINKQTKQDKPKKKTLEKLKAKEEKLKS